MKWFILLPCSTPQINTWTSDWIQFYGEHRLGFQLQLARDQYGDSSIYDKGDLVIGNFNVIQIIIIIMPSYIYRLWYLSNIKRAARCAI